MLTGPFPLLLGGGFCSLTMGCSSDSASWNKPNASRVSGVFLIVYSIIHHHNRNHRIDAPPTQENLTMPLTRDFRETIQARVVRDPAFREELLKESVECLLSGEVEVGKAALRDFINETGGFEKWKRG